MKSWLLAVTLVILRGFPFTTQNVNGADGMSNSFLLDFGQMQDAAINHLVPRAFNELLTGFIYVSTVSLAQQIIFKCASRAQGISLQVDISFIFLISGKRLYFTPA